MSQLTIEDLTREVLTQAHAAANLFPMESEDRLKELAEDIAQKGQRYPIVRWKGAILEGRCRYVACRLRGIEPDFEEREFASEEAAIGFVVSANLKRRFLSESQRALIGA